MRVHYCDSCHSRIRARRFRVRSFEADPPDGTARGHPGVDCDLCTACFVGLIGRFEAWLASGPPVKPKVAPAPPSPTLN